MTLPPDRPEKLTGTEARAGSKTTANNVVLIVSLVAVVIAFAVIFLIYG